MRAAGGFGIVAAQTTDSSTTRIKTSKDVTPSWTYKGQWKGFVTCNRLQRQGNTVSADDIKKCIAAGGTYILAGGGRTDIQPKEKAEQYAGQEVLITGTMTSQRYGTGPTSDSSIEGLYAGGDRPATKFQGVTIISAKILPKEAPTRGVDSSRISDAAQQ